MKLDLGFPFALLTGVILAATAPAAESVPVRVSISTQPPGASVIVDGQDRGVTPITLFDIAPGRHHLKLRSLLQHQ